MAARHEERTSAPIRCTLAGDGVLKRRAIQGERIEEEHER
jgi:hypothetical protein